jgi:type II secretory pathway pseudopilin PulG
MSPLKISLIVGLLSAAVTAGGLRYFHQGRVRELQSLQAQNERLRFEAYQRVQGQAGAKPSTTSTTPAVAPAVPAPPQAPAGKLAEYYRNEGNATPLATLQTFAWAGDRGDIVTVQRLLYIDAAARPKAEAFMASQPENVRAQWKTVDEMAAALLTKNIMAQPFPNAEILETATVEPIGPDRVKLRMPNVPKDGTEYQKTDDGWKYVLTEKVVDDYIRQMGAQAKP